MFVSRSGMNRLFKFVDGEGFFDEDGLNLMVALNLFAETAGDTDGQKEAIRTDWEGFPGYGDLEEVEAGDIPIMVRCLASFGLTAVWYPKYRIASASACIISKKLCQNWLTMHTSKAETLNDAKKEWDAILKTNLNILTNPEGQQPLKSRIDRLLTDAKIKFNSATSATLKNMIDRYPEGKTFKEKFDKGGEYFELIEMQVLECQKAFHNTIEQTLHNQLAKIDFEGTYGLGDVQAFFEALDKEIEKIIAECPALVPSLDLNKLDFAPMYRSENNTWTKLVGLQDQSIEAHRKALIGKYCELISGDRTSIYASVRNHFLRSVLQEVRAELGFGIQPMDTNGPNRTRTIKQRLDQIEANLNGCLKKFTEDYKIAIHPPRSECVKIVTNNAQNQIDADASEVSYQVFQMNVGGELLHGETMGKFLASESEDITLRMTETYRRLSLGQIQVDDVVTKTQAILDTGDNEIRSLASRSNPYQTFRSDSKSDYESDRFRLNTPPKIIFGHDPTGNVLPTLRQNLDSPNLGFPRQGGSSVDHLLFFYQEEAGFTLKHLDSHEALERHFKNSPGVYGHSTHQDPHFYDLALYHKTEKLQRWCRALGQLVPEICHHINKDAFSKIFHPTKTDTFLNIPLMGCLHGLVCMMIRTESKDSPKSEMKPLTIDFSNQYS